MSQPAIDNRLFGLGEDPAEIEALRTAAVDAATAGLSALVALRNGRPAKDVSPAALQAAFANGTKELIGLFAEAPRGAFKVSLPTSVYTAAMDAGGDTRMQLQTLASNGMLEVVADSGLQQVRRGTLAVSDSTKFVVPFWALFALGAYEVWANWPDVRLWLDRLQARSAQAVDAAGRLVQEFIAEGARAYINWWIIIGAIGLLGVVIYFLPEIKAATRPMLARSAMRAT